MFLFQFCNENREINKLIKLVKNNDIEINILPNYKYMTMKIFNLFKKNTLC